MMANRDGKRIFDNMDSLKELAGRVLSEEVDRVVDHYIEEFSTLSTGYLKVIFEHLSIDTLESL